MPGFCLSDETRLMLAPWLPRNTHTHKHGRTHTHSICHCLFLLAHTHIPRYQRKEKEIKMFRVPAGVGKKKQEIRKKEQESAGEKWNKERI